MSDTETVSMHEVSLTYPVPFWLQGADATTGNTHSRMRQKAGFLAHDYVPKGQDFDRWQSSLGISTLYAPGNTWPQFSKAVQEGYASACGKNAQIDVVQDAANHRVLHLRCGEGEQQEGYLYLGVLKSTFVTVYQGWRNASSADAKRYRTAALQGVGRIRLGARHERDAHAVRTAMRHPTNSAHIDSIAPTHAHRPPARHSGRHLSRPENHPKRRTQQCSTAVN